MSRLPKAQSDLVKRGQGWKCRKCGKSIKSGGHIHHKDSDPTNNKIGNLVAVCARCHQEITKKRGKRAWLDKWTWG